MKVKPLVQFRAFVNHNENASETIRCIPAVA